MTQLFPLLRRYLPDRLKQRLRQQRLRFVRIRHRSRYDQVLHCCVHKTASQWMRAILSDPRIYAYSGLLPYHYQTERMDGRDTRPLHQRTFATPFPSRSIISPLYVAYPNFVAIPKPEKHRAVFVVRDPRDILVSWYFSSRYSHPVASMASDERATLSSLPISKGLLYAVDHLETFGLFQAIRSWIDTPQEDEAVLLLRYEDLTGATPEPSFRHLLDHIDVPIPEGMLRELLEDYRFERISGGRQPGEEDPSSKYRKGTPGDWVNHFDDAIAASFEKVAGDLVPKLGYG